MNFGLENLKILVKGNDPENFRLNFNEILPLATCKEILPSCTMQGCKIRITLK